jgi:DME family drug/metabolite transporter
MTSRNAISKLPPQVLVLVAVLMWSTGGVLIKLTSLDAFQVTFFRSLLAAITVLLLTRKSGLRLNAFGAITSIIYAVLLFLFVWATKHTTAANAIFLQYTAPIYILILGPFIIGERFHWRDLATIIFCIFGMTLFFVGKLELNDYWGNIAAPPPEGCRFKPCYCRNLREFSAGFADFAFWNRLLEYDFAA